MKRRGQLAFDLRYKGRGGPRKGAGRPRKQPGTVPHLKRPSLSRHHPVHVTLRLVEGLANLRTRQCYRAVLPALEEARERDGFRVVELSLQSNHLHLIAEADDQAALSRGIQSLAIRVAKSTFRPCCDNSTFFQDCNHGSALYGLLQLGASQGLREVDLYREALAFNSFWFEHHYVRTALYFAVERGVAWRDADPKEVMGRKYSSLSQWSETIEAWAERNPDLFPQAQGAGDRKLDLTPQSQGGAKCGA